MGPCERCGAGRDVKARALRDWLDGLAQRLSLWRWRRLAEAAEAADLERLRRMRGQARRLRRLLDQVIHEGDYRLALPVIGPNPIRRPMGSDWAWRPDLWRGPIGVPGQSSVGAKAEVCPGTTIFHDCRNSELTFRQIRNSRAEDVAPFGFRMDVFRFDGSYLSLALDLPEAAAQGLKARHLIRMEAVVSMEKPLEIFARLNIRLGPNVEQMVSELPLGGDEAVVEFDLAYSRINERRVERLWVDLIFEGPEMNQVIVHDVIFSRLPRSEL